MNRNRTGCLNNLRRIGKGGVSSLPFLLVPFLLIFYAQEALCAIKEAADAPSIKVPASILYLGDQVPAYALLVDKPQQRLHLYLQGPDEPMLIKTFACATGENSGGKKRRGDKRTPEGVYFFTRFIEGKNLSSIYGIRAFPMDYPNLLDRLDYLKGDGIWLHGTDKPLTANSTNGCIVLDNRDVAELSQYIRLRQTPIIIEEQTQYTTLEEFNADRDRLRQLLQEWKTSWENKQLDRYMSFYSPDFRSKGMDWKSWRDYKNRLNRQYRTIQITIEPPIILKQKHHVIAVFFQTYQSDRLFNEGTKRLYLVSGGGEWKIIGEEWHVDRGGEVPPPISESVLAAFLTPKAASAKPAAGPASSVPKAGPEKTERDLSQTFSEVLAFLETWRKSWETKDLDQYMNCYSRDFRSQGKGWERWREHKSNLNALYRQIQVSLEGIIMQEKNGQIIVSFRQNYRSDGLKSTGQKSLTLRKEENSWKIIGENFAASSDRLRHPFKKDSSLGFRATSFYK